jgi:glycerophosphoryl diester phosphodiesterase
MGIFSRIILISLGLTLCQAKDFDHDLDISTKEPLNIGHRGSSGRYPEHTLAAYSLAVEEGADLIECDVCLSKDLVPVCLHEPWLKDITDVAHIFPDRLTTR